MVPRRLHLLLSGFQDFVFGTFYGLRMNVLLSASSDSHSGIVVDPFKYDFLYPHHASFIKWGIISPLSIHFRTMQFTTESFKLNANFL